MILDTISHAPAPAARRAGQHYEPEPLPSEKVTLDQDAVRALRPDDTDTQIARHGLGDNGGYLRQSVKRWEAESLAVWLGCEPAEIIIEDRPKEVEVDARNTPVKCRYCGKVCGGSAGLSSHERKCRDNQANASEVVNALDPEPTDADEGHVTLADLVADGISVSLVPTDDSRALRMELIDAKLQLITVHVMDDRGLYDTAETVDLLDRVRELIAAAVS